MLFLHGIGGNRHNWDRQVAAFSTQYRAAAWDARGYGDSEDYAGPLDFADFGRDLERVLDEPEFRQKQLVDKGYDVVGSSPEAFEAFLKADSASRARAVKISGAKAE